MPQDIIEKIRLAGSVHDIGKIGVSETILNKPGKLTELEYWHMTCHSEVGVHILALVVQDREVLKMIRHHHEHWDGRGYPHRLRGEQIPPGARILQVADAYDAMTSERPYRGAMSAEAACAEIERRKGTQFAPNIADAFLRMKRPEYSVGGVNRRRTHRRATVLAADRSVVEIGGGNS